MKQSLSVSPADSTTGASRNGYTVRHVRLCLDHPEHLDARECIESSIDAEWLEQFVEEVTERLRVVIGDSSNGGMDSLDVPAINQAHQIDAALDLQARNIPQLDLLQAARARLRDLRQSQLYGFAPAPRTLGPSTLQQEVERLTNALDRNDK
jgi:hypothetical protein